jgi:hypothetical protein
MRRYLIASSLLVAYSDVKMKNDEAPKELCENEADEAAAAAVIRCRLIDICSLNDSIGRTVDRL